MGAMKPLMRPEFIPVMDALRVRAVCKIISVRVREIIYT
jgi:hypothetical protein